MNIAATKVRTSAPPAPRRFPPSQAEQAIQDRIDHTQADLEATSSRLKELAARIPQARELKHQADQVSGLGLGLALAGTALLLAGPIGWAVLGAGCATALGGRAVALHEGDQARHAQKEIAAKEVHQSSLQNRLESLQEWGAARHHTDVLLALTPPELAQYYHPSCPL